MLTRECPLNQQGAAPPAACVAPNRDPRRQQAWRRRLRRPSSTSPSQQTQSARHSGPFSVPNSASVRLLSLVGGGWPHLRLPPGISCDACCSSVTAASSTNAHEPKRLLAAGSVGALMFVELCVQRAAEFMQELLKPVFNTIFRFVCCDVIPGILRQALRISPRAQGQR